MSVKKPRWTAIEVRNAQSAEETKTWAEVRNQAIESDRLIKQANRAKIERDRVAKAVKAGLNPWKTKGRSRLAGASGGKGKAPSSDSDKGKGKAPSSDSDKGKGKAAAPVGGTDADVSSQHDDPGDRDWKSSRPSRVPDSDGEGDSSD
jgi:hypothetical protein